MNKTHRLIWNNARQSWIVAHEAASTRGKPASPKKHLFGAVAVALLANTVVAAPAATTVPTGGQVVAGQATISQAANRMTVAQSTNKAILNWNSFSIGSQASVTFQQPSSSAVALNRVLGSTPSAIFGSLTANGQVFLINPNGVLFGQGARIDVGGLVASTLNIRNEDFLAGNYRFTRDGASGSIVNQGELYGQYIALLAPEVRNQGVISAHQGTVVLAAGDAVTLGITGNRLIDVQVDKASINTLIENKHLVQADQGTVILSAQSANSLLGQVINTGAISAKGISADGGTVRLLASSDIEHSGSIDVSAGEVGAGGTAIVLADLANFASRTTVSGSIAALGGTQSGDGGFIETSASKVSIADAAQINARATRGKAGEWLIDPTDYTIAAAGGDMTGAALSATLGGGTNVVIQSTNGASGTGGDVFVNDTVSWNAPASLTLNAQRSIEINAPISVLNGGGGLNLQFGQSDVEGNFPAGNYLVNAPVNLAAGSTFTTKYGSDGATTNYTVITSDAGLVGVGTNLAGNYVLGSDVTATTNPWIALGNADGNIGTLGAGDADFIGVFDGLGHKITGIQAANTANQTGVGLFGSIGLAGLVQNLGIVTGGGGVAGLGSVGILAGISAGFIFNVYTQGSVAGSDTATNMSSVGSIGGLVGVNNGLIASSYSSASVSATSGIQAVGMGADGGIGGLVGVNNSTINDSYATGAVTGARDVGGLVGFSLGSIGASFSTGAVTGVTDGNGAGPTNIGSVVGALFPAAMPIPLLFNTYWVSNSAGSVSASDGANTSTRLSVADAKLQANWTDFDFTTSWVMYDTVSFPLLRSMLTPLIVTANDQSKTYTGTVFSGTNTAVYSSALPPNSTFTSNPNPPTVTFSGAWQTGLNAGTYAITPAGVTLSNAAMIDPHGYLIRFVDGALTIAPAALTVTASNASKVFGQTPTLTAFTSNGLQNGETIGSVTQTSAGTAGTASVDGSPYAIVPSAATGGTFSASNYTLSYVNGSLTVTPATVTVPVPVTATDQKSVKIVQQSLQDLSQLPSNLTLSPAAIPTTGSSFIDIPKDPLKIATKATTPTTTQVTTPTATQTTTPTDTPTPATTAKDRTNEILEAIKQKIDATVFGLSVMFASPNMSDADKQKLDLQKKAHDEATAKADIVLSGVPQDIQKSVTQLLEQKNLVNDLSAKQASAVKEANAAKLVADEAAVKAASSAAVAVELAAAAKADPTSIEKQIAANNAALQAQSDKGVARKTATAADKLTATATNAAAAVVKASSTVTAIESKVTLQLSEADVVTAKQTVMNNLSTAVIAKRAVDSAKVSVVAANKAVADVPALVAKEAKAAEQVIASKKKEAEVEKIKADKLQVEAENAAAKSTELAAEAKAALEAPQKAGIIAQIKSLVDAADAMAGQIYNKYSTALARPDFDGHSVLNIHKVMKRGTLKEDVPTLQQKLANAKQQLSDMIDARRLMRNKGDEAFEQIKLSRMASDGDKLNTVNADGITNYLAHNERHAEFAKNQAAKASAAATAAAEKAAAARAESDRLTAAVNSAIDTAPDAKAAAEAAARRTAEAEATAKTMADRATTRQAEVDTALAEVEASKVAAAKAEANSAASRIVVKKAEAEKAAADEVYRLKTIAVAKEAVTQRATYAKETKAAATDARAKADKAAADTLAWQTTVDEKAKQIPLLTKAAGADAVAAATLRAEADAAAVKWSATDAAREKLKPAAEAADTKRLATEKALKSAEKELEDLGFAPKGADALTIILSAADEIVKAGRKAAAEEKVANAQAAYDTASADWKTKQTEYNNLVIKANTESTAEQAAVSKFNQANEKAENSSTAQKLAEAQKVAAEKNVVTFTKYANAAAVSARALETEAASAAKDAARDKP